MPYQSGVTGVAGVQAPAFDPALITGAFGSIGTAMMGLAGHFVTSMVGVLTLSLGAGLIIMYLRRLAGAGVPVVTAVDPLGFVNNGRDEFYDPQSGFHIASDGSFGYSDDSGGEEPADIGGGDDDDGSDDDEEDGTSAGIGDDVECVSCGAELAYGWDYNYCDECAEIS
jgi:hypothetical protein